MQRKPPTPQSRNPPRRKLPPRARQRPERAAKIDAPKHDVMAIVNGQDIRREALAAACVDRYGKDTLEGLVNKRLIVHHCHNRNITVTDQEIDAEIDRMAARFKIGREQWLQMLEKERGINERAIQAAISSGRRSPCASWRPTAAHRQRRSRFKRRTKRNLARR